MIVSRVFWSPALIDTARFGCFARAPMRRIPSGKPDVDTVTRRGETVSKRMSSAASTASRFNIGSPIPMKTIEQEKARCSRATARYWATISPP
jgi:hypothetical protein